MIKISKHFKYLKMSYLKCLDCETVDSTNNVSRFSHENQSEVKQGVTRR